MGRAPPRTGRCGYSHQPRPPAGPDPSDRWVLRSLGKPGEEAPGRWRRKAGTVPGPGRRETEGEKWRQRKCHSHPLSPCGTARRRHRHTNMQTAQHRHGGEAGDSSSEDHSGSCPRSTDPWGTGACWVQGAPYLECPFPLGELLLILQDPAQGFPLLREPSLTPSQSLPLCSQQHLVHGNNNNNSQWHPPLTQEPTCRVCQLPMI